ncbi:MAG: hypothetical protein M1813_000747 [Trichoglossum hirsutum]|jgi:hypothetical protein|nr:MAG: hypothetical protein M1813_000747 [Trichoglossum hirsutum]
MDEISSCSFFSLTLLHTLEGPDRDQTLAIVDKLWPRLSLMEHDTPVQYYSAFFEEPPRNWWQLFSGRRNKLQWATFWIAVLVLMLALIGLAGNTVPAVYSVKQYNLALAQACSASEATALLPGFCN